MGTWAVIAAHVLFNIAVVALLVRARLQGMDRSLVEASEDLYATPLGTFRQVVLPLLAPSILAGFLLAFTFSFEDFIIAYFVAGPDTTLPIYIFSSIRRGVTPEINAVGSVVLLTSFVLLILAQAILRRGERTVRDIERPRQWPGPRSCGTLARLLQNGRCEGHVAVPCWRRPRCRSPKSLNTIISVGLITATPSIFLGRPSTSSLN